MCGGGGGERGDAEEWGLCDERWGSAARLRNLAVGLKEARTMRLSLLLRLLPPLRLCFLHVAVKSLKRRRGSKRKVYRRRDPEGLR